MKANVSIESLNGPAGDFLLVSVTQSEGMIGICDTSAKNGICRKTFYVAGESLVDIQYKEKDNETNRIIWQTSSIEKTKAVLGTKLSKCCDNYFSGSAPLSKAIMPVLEMLSNGLYVVHIGKVFPTDGAGNFFWDAFTVKHEIYGSAPHNPVIGSEKCFSPPFLVPTQAFSGYSESGVRAVGDKLASGKRLGGIAYHLTGMFSALIEGHLNAAACAANNFDFNCIIIEPLNNVIYGEPGSIDENKVVALSCPFVKISFDNISRKMLETFFVNRSVCIPKEYEQIKWKADKMHSNGVLSRKINAAIERNVEGYPDAEMMASAYAINELTDNDLNVLLSGSAVDAEGKAIISQNFYESITYAINYLQLKDRKRFIEFAGSILKNPDLSGAYSYVVNRLKYVMDAKVNELFKYILDTENDAYTPLKATAERYASLYSEYNEGTVKRFLNTGGSGNMAGLGGLSGGRSAAEALIELGNDRRAEIEEDALTSLEISKQMKKK